MRKGLCKPQVPNEGSATYEYVRQDRSILTIAWDVFEARWKFGGRICFEWEQPMRSALLCGTGQVIQNSVFFCSISSRQWWEEWSVIRITKSFKNLACEISPFWLVLQEFHLFYYLSKSRAFLQSGDIHTRWEQVRGRLS